MVSETANLSERNLNSPGLIGIVCSLFWHLLQDLLHLTEVDLRKMGIENQVHRTHIVSNILLLQEVEKKRGKIFMLSPKD